MPKRTRRINRHKYPKRHNNYNGRNWDDPIYKQWRKDVYRRDKYKCQWPGCRCRKRLNAHHILRWSEYPMYRFEVSNGITLCKNHHEQIKGNEANYVKMFHRIIMEKIRKENK